MNRVDSGIFLENIEWVDGTGNELMRFEQRKKVAAFAADDGCRATVPPFISAVYQTAS